MTITSTAARRFVRLGLATGLAILVGSVSTIGQETSITIEAPGSPTFDAGDLIRQLMDVLPSEVVQVDARKYEQEIKCEAIRTGPWRSVFEFVNSRVLSSRSGLVEVRLPPCLAFTNANVALVAGNPAELAALSQSFRGSGGPNNVMIGDKVYIGAEKVTATFAVDESRIPEIKKVVAAFVGVTVSERTVDEGYQVPEAIPASEVGHCEPGSEPDWPFDRAKVLQVLLRNRALHEPDRVVIGVVDTGIGANEQRRLFLQESKSEKDHSANRIDDDDSGYPDDVFGVNVAERSPSIVAPQPKRYERAWHGTHVAALTLGGLVKDALTEEVEKRLSVRVINVVLCSRVASERCFIPVNVLGEAIKYSVRPTLRVPPNIRVLNVSIGAAVPDGQILSDLTNSTSLVVAAAGNDGTDLINAPLFPAYYGQHSLPRFLVVAAHDGKNELTTRSNRSSGIVDLAAPGCLIESLEMDGERIKYSGTSQAAPLVTFAAALLISEGVIPSEAKTRILASVNKKPAVADVRSHGRLDVETALSIYDDVVVLKSGKRVTGIIQEPKCVNVETRCLAWREIYRVERTSASSFATAAFRVRNVELPGSGRMALDAISISVSGDPSASGPIKGEDIEVIIPAMRSRRTPD